MSLYTPPEKATLDLLNMVHACPLTRQDDRIKLDFSGFMEKFCTAFEKTNPKILQKALIAFLESEMISPEIDMHTYIEHYCKHRLKPPVLTYAVPNEVKEEIQQTVQFETEGGMLTTAGLMQLHRIFRFELAKRLDSISPPCPDVPALLKSRVLPIPQAFLMSQVGTAENEAIGFPNKFIFMALNIKQRHAWEAVKDTIMALGGHVEIIDGKEHTSARHAFVRDPAIILPNHSVILPRRTHSTMREEQPVIKKHLQRLGYTDFHDSESGVHGGNIVYYPEKKVIFVGGTDHADCLEEIKKLKHSTPDYTLVPLTIRSQHSKTLFHLDFCLAHLGQHQFIACLDALTPESRQILKQWVPLKNIVEVDPETARKKACNIVMVGNTAICPYLTEHLKHEFNARHIETVDPARLGLKAGSFDLPMGSAHCITNEIPLAAIAQASISPSAYRGVS